MPIWRTYYARLGVSRNAAADEIRRAFRQKARMLHPDLQSRGACVAVSANAVLLDVADTHGRDKLRTEV